jgi:hypothetical protein
VRRTPIVSWQIQTFPDAEPRITGITADPYEDAWFVLTPEGAVIDSMAAACRWDTVESFVADSVGVSDCVDNLNRTPDLKRPRSHLRLVSDSEGQPPGSIPAQQRRRRLRNRSWRMRSGLPAFHTGVGAPEARGPSDWAASRKSQGAMRRRINQC